MDVLCPAGTPDPDLAIGGLPASLLIEPLGGENEAGYCKRMRQSGEWGSTAEILALTRLLNRPIRVHTSFGVDEYGTEHNGAPAIAVHFENSHYRAVSKVNDDDDDRGNSDSRISALRGGSTQGSACTADEAVVGAVLDSLHAAAADADASKYFEHFRSDAVFLGTDPGERWPIEDFREYAGARFAQGDGWRYEVITRHVTVRADVAWFDERLHNAKLGDCRSSGVLVRVAGDPPEADAWRIAQYNLAMAIPNEHALEVASLVRRGVALRDQRDIT